MVLISIASVMDPSLAPAGKHTLHAYLPATEPWSLWEGALLPCLPDQLWVTTVMGWQCFDRQHFSMQTLIECCLRARPSCSGIRGSLRNTAHRIRCRDMSLYLSPCVQEVCRM